MKKRTPLYLTLLLASGLGILCAFKFFPLSEDSTVLKKTNFINRLLPTQDFSLRLYYGNADLSHLEGYTLTKDTLSQEQIAFAPYSEGFLPQPENEHLLKIVNDLREKQGKKPLSYFYHYQRIGDYAFASSSEGLEAFYLIDLNTLEVSTPILEHTEAAQPQYVYQIRQIGDIYAILTAGVNELTARLYTFSPNTLELNFMTSTTTDATALSRQQYALDSLGKALFTHEKGIEVVAKEEHSFLKLSFTPQMLVSHENSACALAIEGSKLHYALIDSSSQSIEEGSLLLPNVNLSLVDSFIQGNLLYTITYDAQHPMYKHYISIYDLSLKELIFCEGLSDNGELALLKISVDYTQRKVSHEN